MRKKSLNSMRIKHLAILVLLVLTSSMMLQTAHAGGTTLQFVINNGVITYGGPTSLTFTTALNVTFGLQSINQNFTGSSDYFWVQDMEGTDNGYSTTLQLSGNLISSGNSISGSNVSFMAISGITLLSGLSNPRVILDAATSSYQALNGARNYIMRDAAANSGVIGYYGSLINLKVDVPGGQPAGAYVGTLVYTLIEN